MFSHHRFISYSVGLEFSIDHMFIRLVHRHVLTLAYDYRTEQHSIDMLYTIMNAFDRFVAIGILWLLSEVYASTKQIVLPRIVDVETDLLIRPNKLWFCIPRPMEKLHLLGNFAPVQVSQMFSFITVTLIVCLVLDTSQTEDRADRKHGLNSSKLGRPLRHIKWLDLLCLGLPLRRVFDLRCLLHHSSLTKTYQVLYLVLYYFFETLNVPQLKSLDCYASQQRVKIKFQPILLCSCNDSVFEYFFEIIIGYFF